MKKEYDYTEQQAKEYAKENAKSVEIRSFEKGRNYDTWRKSTKVEAALIERAIASALIAIKSGYDEDSAKATAEFFVLHNSGETHINSYGSVYCRVNDFLKGKVI